MTSNFPGDINKYQPYVPGIVIEDPSVDPVVEPGGSFIIGQIERTDPADNIHINDCDIIINREFSFDTDINS